MRQAIVVGTDLTEASDDALIQAEARAARDGVALTVAHAMPPKHWSTGRETAERERARETIVEQMAAFTGRTETEFEVVIQRGSPHLVLTEVAAQRDALLVVGSALEHGFGHALVRNISERVVHRARGPVLVTRPNHAGDSVLVAVDQTADSAALLAAANDEAVAAESKLVVLHCLGSGFLKPFPVEDAQPSARCSQIWKARRALNAELVKRGIEHELYIAEGPPERMIGDIAREMRAELIVIGTSGYLRPTPHTTADVLRRACCSVLVVASGHAHAVARPPMRARSA